MTLIDFGHPVELATLTKVVASITHHICNRITSWPLNIHDVQPLSTLDLHISRISRENGKWFCETFLARNEVREIARKMGQIVANLKSNLTEI